MRRYSGPKFYILDADNEPIAVDMDAWARWFETAERHVAFTVVAPGVEVSTVFLGLDHNYSDEGPPILWETMVFDDYGGGDQYRYSSYAEALEGHNSVVAELGAKALERLKQVIQLAPKDVD